MAVLDDAVAIVALARGCVVSTGGGDVVAFAHGGGFSLTGGG